MRRSRRPLSPAKAASVVGLGLLSAIAALMSLMMLYGHYRYGQPINLFVGCLLIAIILFPETRLDWQWRCILPFVVTVFLLSF